MAINLNDLPAPVKPFKVAPYVRAAVLLQQMGEKKACETLVNLAQGDDEGQVAVLCRLLFSKKGKTQFREPGFGRPVYLGESKTDDWPLSPIEVIDGVPFFVVQNYRIGGTPEPSLRYLAFCLESCEWSKVQFHIVTDKTIERALQKLLVSKKWRRPLADFEREYLISQTK